ncbi:MAG: DUF167 domain-containing protein [Deltaproteobacteria bacterium]|nr:DUF167 domain-containing protein [Candidatus Zymogenaceae bacterium]
MLEISRKADACSFAVSVKTSSRNSRIVGEDNGVLKVEVTAAPVEGKANEAVVKLIARSLNVAPSRVSIAAGQKSKKKRIAVSGIDPESILRLADR